MVADVVKNVGGEFVEVTALMGPGVDPHLYKASEGTVIKLAEADVIFYNGLHLEAQMAKVFDRMQGRIKTVAVTDGIDRLLLLSPPEFGEL
jgi:manganese/zinc/iron transport system substrate-binding protein